MEEATHVTFPATTRVRAAPDTLMQELEGESVLLSLASERYFGLDEVGTRIWHFDANGIEDFKGTYEEYQTAVQV